MKNLILILILIITSSLATAQTQAPTVPGNIVLGEASKFCALSQGNLFLKGAGMASGYIGAGGAIEIDTTGGGVTGPPSTFYAQALADFTKAKNNLTQLPGLPVQNYDFGARSFIPGVYSFNQDVVIPEGAVLTLTGPSSAYFVFNISENLLVGRNAKMVLNGGIKASHIFWNVGKAINLKSNCNFIGVLMGGTAINLEQGVSGTKTLLSAGSIYSQSGLGLDDTGPIVDPDVPAIKIPKNPSCNMLFNGSFDNIKEPCDVNNYNVNNSEFGTEFVQTCGTSVAGYYRMVKNSKESHDSGWESVNEHTGNANSKMMLVDGYHSGNANGMRLVWSKTLSLLNTPGDEFQFSFYYATFNQNESNTNFVVYINDDLIGTIDISKGSVGQWQYFTANWNKSDQFLWWWLHYREVARIKIYQTNNYGSLTDLGFDDFFFGQAAGVVVPEEATFTADKTVGCPNAAIQFHSTKKEGNHTWTVSGGGLSGRIYQIYTGSDPVIDFPYSGNYVVTHEIEDGRCPYTSSRMDIQINTEPNANFAISSDNGEPYCTGEELCFKPANSTNKTGFSHHWEIGNFYTSNQKELCYKFVDKGYINVTHTVTDEQHCTSFWTESISVIDGLQCCPAAY